VPTLGGSTRCRPQMNLFSTPERPTTHSNTHKNMELNPNHKVVVQAREQWHKIAALIMVKLGLKELQLTLDDVNKLAKGNVNIVLDARGESKTGILTVRIVDDKTAAEMARKEGGRACDS